MARPWEADHTTGFKRRMGSSPQELGITTDTPNCPDIWEVDNGDIAIVGRDATETLGKNLPTGVFVGGDERLVVIPRAMMVAAKSDIPSV
jgi:hypothetical protein